MQKPVWRGDENAPDARIVITNILWAFSILVLLSSCMNGQSQDSRFPTEPGTYELSTKVGDVERWYTLMIPRSYDGSQSYPLAFAFHGGGSNMKVFYNQMADLRRIAQEENMVLVFPNGTGIGRFANNKDGDSVWTAVHCCGPEGNGDDIAFTDAMIDVLTQELNIDQSRIYALGYSNGGFFTHMLANLRPDVFAAVAVMEGAIGGKRDADSPLQTLSPSNPVAIMMIHGKEDIAVKFDGGLTRDGPRIDISFAEGVAFWVANNGCNKDTVDSSVDQGENGRVWIESFRDCAEDAWVVAIVIENHGHPAPILRNSGFDSSRAIVDFFLLHTSE